MKIAVVVKEHQERKGGLERYAVNLTKGLARAGHEVHVYAAAWDEEPGLIFHYVPYVRWLSILKVLTFPKNVNRHLKKTSFDLVYGLTPFYPLDIYRVGEGLHVDVLRSRYPGPVRRFLRYLNPKHQLILHMEKKLFSSGNFRKIITNSRMLKARVISLYDVDDSKVHVIYNGYDSTRFNPEKRAYRDEIRREFSVSGSEPLILFSANDFKRKGLDYLLHAISILKSKGTFIKLMVTGSGGRGDIERYRRLASSMGLGGEVVFTGRVSDMERYYGAADIFVLPTLYDPFANACLEAMACGLPVITTGKNGASEIITDGVDGFVIDDPSSTHIMADRICSLLQMNAEEGVVSEEAARKAAGFTIEKNIMRTLEVCRGLAGDEKVVNISTGRVSG